MQPLEQNLNQPQHQMMKEKMRKNLHQTTEREMREMKKPMRNETFYFCCHMTIIS